MSPALPCRLTRWLWTWQHSISRGAGTTGCPPTSTGESSVVSVEPSVSLHISHVSVARLLQVCRQRTRWKTYPPRHASLHDNATYLRSLIALPTPHCHLLSTQVQTKLLEVYSNVADVDLWVGGLLERQDPGAQLGPTFSCIIAGQFRKIRDGDRCDHVPGLSLQASGPPSVSPTGSGSSGQASSPLTS